jgi:hypothetical protein
MRVLIFLLVALMRKIDSMWGLDVESPGVGNVERNIVANTTTLKQGKNYLQQKTIMMPFVVGAKKDSSKKTIVGEAVQAIVHLDGLNHC